MTTTISISIRKPRNYVVTDTEVIVKFLTRLDAEDYVLERRYKDYVLLPHVDYNVERNNFKYWRKYKLG